MILRGDKKGSIPESNAIRLSLAAVSENLIGRWVKKRLYVFSRMQKRRIILTRNRRESSLRHQCCTIKGVPLPNDGFSRSEPRAKLIWHENESRCHLMMASQNGAAKLCQRDQNLLIIFSHLFMWEVVFPIKTAEPCRVSSLRSLWKTKLGFVFCHAGVLVALFCSVSETCMDICLLAGRTMCQCVLSGPCEARSVVCKEDKWGASWFGMHSWQWAITPLWNERVKEERKR